MAPDKSDNQPPAGGIPWWLPFTFLGAYAVVLVTLVITGHIAPREFEAQFALVLTTAFGVQISPAHRKADKVAVTGDQVEVTETPDKAAKKPHD